MKRMAINKFFRNTTIAAALISLAAGATAAETTASAGLKQTTQTVAQNVILITADGLRWQEVFRGLDADMASSVNQVNNPERLLSEFDADTTAARREKLMPFFWGHIARNGIVYGNRDEGSVAHVKNNHWFSYPGYNEFLTGFPDDARIRTNNKVPNPNATVFEWLNNTEGISGRVAAFGAWDCFPYIFNSTRSKLPVDDGLRAFKPRSGVTPVMEAINSIRATTPLRWNGAHFDSLVYPMAVEYLKTQKPRALYIGLGETDNWAHEGNYEKYLEGAHRVDAWLKEMYELTQSLPEYKDNTTFIITCDHGRGDTPDGPKAWNNHNRSTPGSDSVWMAVWGPDTPATGVLSTGTVTLGQTAATVAAALGLDYNAAQPQAASPLPGAIQPKNAPAPSAP